MILAIDFDGTIVDHRFPRVGAPAPGAIKWLRRFQELGAKLILWTMRSDGREDGGNYLADAVNHCRTYGIEFWAVNGNPDQAEWTTSPKCYAQAYVDDMAVGCPMIHPDGFARPCVDWEAVGPQIERMLLAKRAD